MELYKPKVAKVVSEEGETKKEIEQIFQKKIYEWFTK